MPKQQWMVSFVLTQESESRLEPLDSEGVGDGIKFALEDEDMGLSVSAVRVDLLRAEEEQSDAKKADDQGAEAGTEGAGAEKDPDLTPETTSC